MYFESLFIFKSRRLIRGGSRPFLMFNIFSQRNFLFRWRVRKLFIFKKGTSGLLHKGNRKLNRLGSLIKPAIPNYNQNFLIFKIPLLLVSSLFLKSRFVFYLLFQTSTNVLFVIKRTTIKAVQLFTYFITQTPLLYNFKNCLRVAGYLLSLVLFLKVNTLITHIPNKNTGRIQFSTAYKSLAKLLSYNKLLALWIVQLPSKQFIFLSSYLYVIKHSVYYTTAFSIHKLKKLKAGKSRLLGRRPTVRGVAKNPIDHPHGGRTNTVSPPRTPWGLIAKKNK